MSLKIIFAGSSEFAIPSLAALLDSKHTVVAIYTIPDRIAGRGMKLTPSPVKQFALSRKFTVYQPESLKLEEVQQTLRSHGADVFIDVAYGLIIPSTVLDMFRFNCINVHPSLLPRWRGAAPIQRAILEGDKVTGVTVMQVDEGLDTGPILRQSELVIEATDTSETMHEKLGHLGAQLLIATLDDLLANKITPISQNNAESTYAAKLEKQEAKIDWKVPVDVLDCIVRAFNPWPVAFTSLHGELIKIWQATIVKVQSTGLLPGTIVNVDKNGIDVATKNGILRILKIQLAGGKILPVAEILNSNKNLFSVGANFDA
jgi:methionyl-tRNA formyltransferase